jgi:hypothetical protein
MLKNHCQYSPDLGEDGYAVKAMMGGGLIYTTKIEEGGATCLCRLAKNTTKQYPSLWFKEVIEFLMATITIHARLTA